MKKHIFSIIALTGALFFTSCNEDALDKDPQSEISLDNIRDNINSNPAEAANILGGLESGNQRYLVEYVDTDFTGYISVKLGTDLMSNDMTMATWHWMGHYYNYLSRNSTSNQTYYIWRFNYKVIYNMNLILDYMPEWYQNDPKLVQLKGRVLAMRAAAYFDLIRLYANGEEGIPYYSKELNDESRVKTSIVYQKIEADLLEAYTSLSGYTRPSNNKDFIDKNVVAGLLSRLYITTGKYNEAAQYANIARQGYAPMSEADLLAGFKDISNSEWMWGSKIDGTTNSVYASFFSHMDNTSRYGYAGNLGAGKSIDKKLFDNISSTDSRKKWFAFETNYNNLPKYTGVKFRGEDNFLGDLVYMRASEMYLLEAESLALAGNESQAKQVLFQLISKRDPQYVLSTNSGQALLDEIRIHKRIELWGEGFAFFDMKRTNTPLERNYTGSNHPIWGKVNYPADSPKMLFQFPQAELNTNTSLTQNPF